MWGIDVVKKSNKNTLFNVILISLVLISSAFIVWAAGVNTVGLVGPSDDHTNWNGTVTFICNVTANTTLDTLYLYNDLNAAWAVNGTQATVVNNTAYSFTTVYTDTQKANWTCWANTTEADTATNQLWSASNNYTISIDNSNPTAINFTNPANMTIPAWTTNNTPLLDWNDTLDPNFLNYTILVTDSNDFDSPNYTYELASVVSNSSFEIAIDNSHGAAVSTAWADGNYYWKVVAYDGAEANGSTVQYTNVSGGFYEYRVDTTDPTKSEPSTMLPDGNHTNDTTPTINWTFTNELGFKNYTIRVSNSTAFTTINYTIDTTGVATNNSVTLPTIETEGTWYWQVIVYDLQNNTNTSATNFSFILDTTDPTKSEPASPVTHTNTSDNTTEFNWTASVDTNFQNYTVQLSDNSSFASINFTFDIIGATTNSSLNSTEIRDGTWYWRVVAYDIAGNSNVSATNFTLNMDATPPMVSHACTPTSVFTGETITCTCSAADAIDSSPSTPSFTASPSTSSAGTFTTTCTSTDYTGNTGTGSVSYTVVSPSSNRGGNSGSATTSKSASFSNVKAGQELIFDIDSDQLYVEELTVVSDEDTSSAKITVRNHASKPSSLEDPKNKVYQYLDISANIKIKESNIEFEVTDSWLNANSLSASNVVLLHYDAEEEEWNELVTTHISGTRYKATAYSFSTFAISAKETATLADKEDKTVTEAVTETVDYAGEAVTGLSNYWKAIIIVVVIGVILLYSYNVYTKSKGPIRRKSQLHKKLRSHADKLHRKVRKMRR